MTLFLLLMFAAAGPGVPVHVTPADVVWHAAPPPFPAGAQLAVLEGKPGEPFPYALRLRLPAGTKITHAMRSHPATVTVLSGSVTADGTAFPSGSYFTITPFAADLVATEESVIQVSGEGPWLKGLLEVAPPVEATIPVRSDDAELALIETTPPPSSEVTAETTARVRIRYNVRNFQPNTYRLDAMFASTQPGASVGAPTTTRSTLTSASGEMTLDIPMARLIAQSNVAKPLRMWIFLLRKTGERTSRPVVRTPTVVFNVK